MGTYDISRVGFDPKKHYSSVRMQQGRVLTDDDWNENERIDNEDRRRARIDIIGPYGTPDEGYLIDNFTQAGTSFDFSIEAGILYLGGLRFHHELETYRLQHDWLEQKPADYTIPALSANNLTQSDLVYLEAWQQPVCAIEDSELFETALGGPDTTIRVRNMARVRIYPGIGNNGCGDAWTQLKNIWTTGFFGTVNDNYERVPNASLQVSFPGNGLPDDLCSPQVIGGYLGAENQAIRVQLRKNNSFTWGYDDGSPLYRVSQVTSNKAGPTTTTVTLITPPKDQYHWPRSGQVVEILSWSSLLPNGEKIAAREGFITKVDVSYDPNLKTFTLATPLPVDFGIDWEGKAYIPALPVAPDSEIFFYMKIWNRGTDITSPAEINFVPPTIAAPIPAAETLGNTGIAIQLYGTDFVAGDYWVIAARPEAPDQVVPWALQLEKGIAPMGIHRFFAPLAIIDWNFDTATGQTVGTIVSDCRKPFKPLTEQECCCTYTVGDGVISKGDFNSIEKAVAALPKRGGKICVLPGIHKANVVIQNKKNIEICGCGGDGIVIPGDKNLKDPIFEIISGNNIKICCLTMVSLTGTAMAVINDQNQKLTSGIFIQRNEIIAQVCAVYINVERNIPGNNNIVISYNRIGMINLAGGLPAICTIADEVLIERNRIVVVPAPDPKNPNDPRPPKDPGTPVYDPCCDHRNTFHKNPNLWPGLVAGFGSYISGFVPTGLLPSEGYLTPGGIQIGSTSERVIVLQNIIIGGAGNGITLGHFFKDPDVVLPQPVSFTVMNNYETYSKAQVDKSFNSTLYEIEIIENEIDSMGLSGIGVSGIFSRTEIGLIYKVEELGIYRNLIQHCALQTDEIMKQANGLKMIDQLSFGGITLTSCGHTIIRENQILNNGRGNEWPVCGVFVFIAEEIELSNNRIINNGAAPRGKLQAGPRAGILIDLAFQLLDTVNTNDTAAPGFDAIPAAIVNENIVEQPVGHALLLMAIGPIVVLGNQLTSRGRDETNKYSALAGAVFLLDLGISKDFLAIIISKNGSWLGLNNSNPSYSVPTNAAFIKLMAVYAYFPVGNIMFSNNQISLDSRKHAVSKFFSAQVIATLDDIAFQNNQNTCIGFELSEFQVTDLVIIDVCLLGITIRSNDNRFTEGLTLTAYSLFSLAAWNTAVHNQSTHCLLVLGAKVVPLDVPGNNIVLNPTPCKDNLRLVTAALKQ